MSQRCLHLGRPKRFGFTLIELITVIAIIAILAAMLWPVGSRMVERGRASVCMSNLRQLALGVALYCGDHDGAFPDSSPYYPGVSGIWYPLLSGIGGGGGGSWPTATYVPHPGRSSKKGPYFCPSNKANISTGSASWTSYAYNSNLAGVRRASVQKKIALFLDSYSSKDKSTWYVDYGSRGNPTWIASDGVHSGGVNVVFVDCHVEYVKVDPAPASLPVGSDRVDLKKEWFWPVN